MAYAAPFQKEFDCVDPFGSFLGREKASSHWSGMGRWGGVGLQAQIGNPIAYLRFNRIGLNSYDIA